jgi:hypothetical protein
MALSLDIERLWTGRLPCRQVLYQLSYVGAASDPSRSRGPT